MNNEPYFTIRPGSIGFIVQGVGGELRMSTSDERHAKLYAATVNRAYQIGRAELDSERAASLKLAELQYETEAKLRKCEQELLSARNKLREMTSPTER